MIELCQDTDLTKKSSVRYYSREIWFQHFYSDRPSVLEILGEINYCHATVT
jgi:hypothetical protein